MRWPIRNQLFVPFAATLLLAVATIALASAWLAARREERRIVDRLDLVVETLSRADFPFTANVLRQMRGLSGAEFVAFDTAGRPRAATLPDPESHDAAIARGPRWAEVRSLTDLPVIPVGEERYFVARLGSPRSPGTEELAILYPERSWREARWESAWPPLAVGGVTLVVVLLVSAALAQRFGRRFGLLRRLFGRIARGDFTPAAVRAPDDELADLTEAANALSAQLSDLQQTVRQTERVRLLAQLAGGLAHQLRNSATGARLAVQLHRKRCHDPDSESVAVALRELELIEEQVKGLLALGRGPWAGAERKPGEVGPLVAEVEALLRPLCRHADVNFEVSCDATGTVPDEAGLRTALLNLGINAVQAAAVGGSVRLDVSTKDGMVCFRTSDSGPGPPAEIADRLFEPFVTAKPEGVGLGLALARRAAEESGGTLSWRREDGRTVFEMRVPVAGW